QHATVGSSSATAFDVDGVDAAVEALAAALEEDEIADAVEDLLSALTVYMDFLDESGRWSGTDSAYEELEEFLINPGGSEDAPGGRPVIVPALTDEEQDEAFKAMPLIRSASSLLEWIGDGKDVTTTGALRLKDIEAASAAVGVNARGRSRAGGPVDTEGVERDPIPDDAPFEVRSMHDVPLLGGIWAAMVRSGLLTLGATRVVAGPQIFSWNSADARERVRIRRSLTLFQLLGSIGYSPGTSPTERMDPDLLIILTLGTGDNPMPVAQLEKLAAEDADPSSAFVAYRAKHNPLVLATLGIVEADTSYRVAEVAIQCVASVLRIIEGEDLLPGEDEDFNLDAGSAGENDARKNDGGAPAKVIPLHNSGSAPKHR
ncbi:MAG: hypothetical protein JWQ75_2898, partial [Pseudarthrobacter sp.]|nr:hypothetical protein [Pseudarthrobacter sp.]